jgi:flagellar biosynthesis chaperone FliJ|tara:strand:+ start:439 stop:711 length:273 start_codon:yes stop_codon:yes gene_type:complete
MSKVKELTKKITDEQLKTVQEQQAKLTEGLRTLGVLDVQKQNVHGQIAELSKEIEATKKELEEKYGQVNIDLKDGSYEEIVEEVSTADAK